MNYSNNKDPFRATLLAALSAFLPNGEQTRLLQACLWSGTRANQAWAHWSQAIDDPTGFLRDDKDGVKGLLPLLFDALQNNGAIVEPEFLTYLKTAYLRDSLRSKTYNRIARDVILALTHGGIPAVVLKGAALAETCYKNPGLQHAHYLEVLVKDSDLNRAVEILRPLDFRRAHVPIRSDSSSLELVHKSRLPLILHRRLFRLPFYPVQMEDIWARSRTDLVCDVPTRLLSPADNLLHICGSVFDAERHDSLRWVCDAWFLIQRYPDLDWNTLLECARRSRVALPLFVTTDYLARSLEAPIPPWVSNDLQVTASKAESIEGEAALFGVQANGRGGLVKIIQSCDNWPTRALVLKWALCPSPGFLRRIHGVRWTFLLPLYYFYHPFKVVGRSIWLFAKRLRRRHNDPVVPTESKALSS